jgi:hypothetical protein
MFEQGVLGGRSVGRLSHGRNEMLSYYIAYSALVWVTEEYRSSLIYWLCVPGLANSTFLIAET